MALAGARMAGQWPAGDLTAYLAAADIFVDGGNPYGPALQHSDHYTGYPYVYPPATLLLIQPLAWLPAPLVSGLATSVSGGLLVYSVASLQARFDLAIPLAPLAFAALCFGPVTADLLAGNLAIVMLAANVAAADLLDDGHVAGLTLVGVVLSFKFMWLVPAFVLVLADGRRRAIAALAAGPLVVAGLSAIVDPGFGAWLDRLFWLREAFPDSLDLLSLAPRLYPIALLAAALLIWSARHESTDLLWAAGCCSVLAWPRLAPYSFAILLPTLAHLAGRLDPRRLALLILPVWGPVYWVLCVPPESLHARWIHYLWAVAVAIALLTTRPPTPHNQQPFLFSPTTNE